MASQWLSRQRRTGYHNSSEQIPDQIWSTETLWSKEQEQLLLGVTAATSQGENETSEKNTNSTKQYYHFYKTEQLTFICILFALIVVGNVTVLVTISLSKKKKSRMNFFIMQLAIADLVTGLVTVLTDVIWKTTEEWHAGTVGCKIIKYLQSVATFASTYVLVALSIDRLDAIARPMNFSTSGTRAKALVAVAWGLAVLFSLPMMVLCREKDVKGFKQCQVTMPAVWGWKVFMTSLFFILFIIPAVIIGACYSVIVSIIWRKSNTQGARQQTYTVNFKKLKRNAGNKSTSDCSKVRQESYASSAGVIPKARIKTIKMTLVIVCVFVCCWSPYFVFDLLDVYGLIPTSQRKIATAIFIQSLSNLNSAANPVIYCLFSTRICQNWRRFSACDWLARVFSVSTHTNNRSTTSGLATMNTDTSCVTDTKIRIHGSGPSKMTTTYINVTLSECDDAILLRHIKTPETRIFGTKEDDVTPL